MKYDIKIISAKNKERYLSKFNTHDFYQLKANIHGTCVKLFTTNQMFRKMWLENFNVMPDSIRPHARIYEFKDPKIKKMQVFYEPETKTVIIKNCDYYGWVKSIALGVVNEFMEDVPSEHRRHSVHGSCVDYDGRGIGIIGPSGSGKTTLTYGLLLNKKFNFITDDWFFVRLKENGTPCFFSERNSYLRSGLEKDWPKYAGKIKTKEKDNKGRFLVDVKKLFGDDRVLRDSNLRAIILLTRDKKLGPIKKLSQKEAIEFLLKNDFCNPHQLKRNKNKKELRKNFFLELHKRVPFYLLNTIETPKKSLERILDLCERYIL